MTPNLPQPMKANRPTLTTEAIVRALRNSTSPAAKLANWQDKVRPRLIRNTPAIQMPVVKRDHLQYAGPELSSPEAVKPLLWLSGETDPMVMNTWAGRKFLNHNGWFQDEFQDDTLETYAVQLKRFPRLLFYGVLDSCNGNIRVELSEWEEIDYRNADSEWYARELVELAAKDLIRCNESSTQKQAEESIEYYRKDRIENDIAENKEMLKSLRQSIRDLARELKTLCPSPMAKDFPAAATALRDSLKSLISQRTELMDTNAKLAAEL